MERNPLLQPYHSILLEAPEDATEGGAEEGFEAAPAEDNPESENTDDANADEGADDAGDDTSNEDNDDFSIDAEDDLGGDDEGGGDSSDSSSEENPAEVDNEDKKRDREIYDSLSPEEQKVKNLALKKNFVALYNRCTQIAEKMEEIGIEYEELIPTIRKSMDALFDLKEMISTYLLYLYDSKSFIENDIYFNRCLTIMNNIKLITRDMKKVADEKTGNKS